MSKCYFAHGGNELVIGGKLTFLPGASIEGGNGLFDVPMETSAEVVERTGLPMPALPDSTATTIAQLREDYNHMLAVLRTAGLIATEASELIGSDPETGT